MANYEEDEFEKKLRMLGLTGQANPYSQEDETPIFQQGAEMQPTGIPGTYEPVATQEMVGVSIDDISHLGAYTPPGPNASFQPEGSPMSPASPTDDYDAEALMPKGNAPKSLEEIEKRSQEKPKGSDADQQQGPKPMDSGVRDFLTKKYGFQEDLGDDALKDAQRRSRNANLGVNIGRAVAGAGATMTDTKMDAGLYDNLSKEADKPVTDLLERRKGAIEENKFGDIQMQQALDKAKLDPQSAVSKDARNQLFSLFPEYANKPGMQNLSYSQMKEMFPMLQLKESTEARKEVAKEAAKSRMLIKQAMDATKSDKILHDRAVKFEESLDPNKQRAGNLADVQKRINAAERLEGLVTKSAAGYNLDQRETEEFAIGVANLLSTGNQTSRSQVQALVPHTAQGSVQKTIEWLTNEPRGVNQQKFVKRMLATTQREKAIGVQQRKDAQMQRISAYEDLPEPIRNNIMYGYGISPEEYQQFKVERRAGAQPGVNFDKIPQQSHGKPAPQAPAAGPKDPKIEQYAQQYTKGDYAAAERILRGRGYGK